MSDELKAHYQNLKARCLEIALRIYPGAESAEPGDDERAAVACAKRLYNEITGENWTGPDVEGA
jgi:hypothetical protein